MKPCALPRSKLWCSGIKATALAKSGNYLLRILLDMFCLYLCKVTWLKLLLLGKDTVNNDSIIWHQAVPRNVSNRVIIWSKHVWSKSSALGCLHLTVSLPVRRDWHAALLTEQERERKRSLMTPNNNFKMFILTVLNWTVSYLYIYYIFRNNVFIFPSWNHNFYCKINTLKNNTNHVAKFVSIWVKWDRKSVV